MHTRLINAASFPGLTFTNMQNKGNPAQSFSLILSPSLSHSFFLLATLFSAGPGWLLVHGGSRVGALLLEQLLVELKRVPVQPRLPASSRSLSSLRHSPALSSSRPHCLE